MVYEEERKMLKKTYRVIKEWRISNTKMKVNDVLEVIDYGSGMADHYVVFENSRLPRYRFHTATSVFKRNTEGV